MDCCPGTGTVTMFRDIWRTKHASIKLSRLLGKVNESINKIQHLRFCVVWCPNIENHSGSLELLALGWYWIKSQKIEKFLQRQTEIQNLIYVKVSLVLLIEVYIFQHITYPIVMNRRGKR